MRCDQMRYGAPRIVLPPQDDLGPHASHSKTPARRPKGRQDDPNMAPKSPSRYEMT